MNGINSTKLYFASLSINITKVSHVRVVAFNLAKRFTFFHVTTAQVKIDKKGLFKRLFRLIF